MRYVEKASWLVLLALLLAISLPPAASGTEHDSDREERSVQLIYNAIHVTQEANAPSPELVDQYRRSGSTSGGVGYRGPRRLPRKTASASSRAFRSPIWKRSKHTSNS